MKIVLRIAFSSRFRSVLGKMKYNVTKRKYREKIVIPWIIKEK